MKKNILDKVRKQLAGVSALVDFWWQTVWHDLAHMALPPRWKQWVDELLLPLMYWQEQLSRTRCPDQKAQIARALQAIQDAFERHPCTRRLAPEVLAGWKAWAGEHARAFQRASSAVEGRNGYLSQIPPDLVVKSQAIDIIGLILSLIRRKTSSKHRVDQGNRALSCSHYLRVIGLPLNPTATLLEHSLLAQGFMGVQQATFPCCL